MAEGDTCAADPVDTVQHEMASAVVVTVFINLCSDRRTTRPREGARQPIHMKNLQYVEMINDPQIVSHTLVEIYSQITWYYITQRSSVVRCLVYVILLGEGGKEKA